MRPALRRAVIDVLRLLRWLLPTRSHVLVHGFPAIEANAVETVRVLLERTPARIIWLDAPPLAFRRSQGLDRPDRVTVRTRWSLGGLWDYLTAEVVFFTHGFYGAPGTVGRKPVVNLWHGNGAKRAQDLSLFPGWPGSGRPYDAVLLAAEAWREEFETVDTQWSPEVWATGYPRNAVLVPGESRPVESLADCVMWAPAFRAARVGRVGWSDVGAPEDGDEPVDMGALVASYAEVLARHGVRLLLRPHPSDAATFQQVENCELVTDAWLEERGLHLYDVLQGVGGLISDVSSIWVDYLLTRRPLGFVFPDIAQYQRGRGFWPEDVYDHQPELFIADEDDMARFATEVAAGRAQRFDPRVLAAECRTIDPQEGALLLAELEHAGMMRRSLR